MFEKLFSPIKIRDLELKNRAVFPAMGTKFADQASMVTDQLIDYHVERAKNGSALNIVEVASVHTPSAPRRFISISEDIYVPGLKRLTDAIHEAGGKAGIQLWQGSLAVGMDKTALILVASDMPVSPEVTLPAITLEQMKEVVDSFAAAARRSVEANFDCVELHAAHNYLVHSFLSGGLNHRTDEYGGPFENRVKFPLEVIRAIRSNIPDTMPLFMRIDAHDDYLEGGLTIEEVIEFCKLAGEAGVDVLDVSRGNILGPAIKYEVPSIDLSQGFNVENAARIRKETGMLTIGVGRIKTPELAEGYLQEDKVDMVVMGRAQLADAAFLKKALAGELNDIDYCIGCNQGCYDGFEREESPHITCMRNPALGRETPFRITKTDEPKTVLIAGGGIGGLEAAIILKQRGHEVILCEATGSLGGQFVTAGEAPRKAEMKAAVLSMAKKVERLGTDIRLNTKVTPELIAQVRPYTFINAIGSKPIVPPIPGVSLPTVVTAHDVLNGARALSGKIVIIGGGMVGIEAAEYLATRGCEVTVLEMLPEIAQDMGTIRKVSVTELVYAEGIVPVTETAAKEIREGEVIGVKNGEEIGFPCETVVIAVGSESLDGSALEQACRENDVAYFAIGDAAQARKAINATREAFDVAMSFDDPAEHAYALRPKKIVVVTGGTGTMGMETLKQLLSRSNRFKTRAIVRPSDKNRTIMSKLACPALEVVWGDMTDYELIRDAVTGADYILHIGAMVSPMADRYPKETLYTNIGTTLNFIKAIKEQPDPDRVHLAFVGSVAMTGGRTDPIHWGRIGDPINPSIFDYYGMSKVFSEMALYDSGLRHWVSIRQTGQHPTNEAAAGEPIITHQNPNNVLEWSTSIESGICMANLCEDWVPEEFWRRAYNLSSGKGYRLTSWELIDLSLGAFGIKFGDVFDPRMLALYNFHGHCYTDADKLDDILHFRCIPAEHYWGGVQMEMSRMAANPMIRAMFPTTEQMRLQNSAVGSKEMGTYWMLEHDKEDWIHAFFGSRERQAAIKSVEEGYEFYHPSEDEPTLLDHGYDESKQLEELTLDELQKAAEFRGGDCLAVEVTDIHTPILWRCADGHEFRMSVNAVLQGGHWCPECLKSDWHYGDIAKKNPFYAQVWTPLHGEEDTYVIPMGYRAYEITQELKEKLGL
ncbi:MAG: FAD-dependent oxidoreductase [Coriobacteriales bacterium]|jgi:2,4-dienoyl-CoA reductase-like NADH-dependent reductase (Old Yellow Enzyme family)/nucleoside-diphosphate-sugar epimerase|nr:FAD-dependent oxidoreductase [Coriobacteriales bacterium]